LLQPRVASLPASSVLSPTAQPVALRNSRDRPYSAPPLVDSAGAAHQACVSTPRLDCQSCCAANRRRRWRVMPSDSEDQAGGGPDREEWTNEPLGIVEQRVMGSLAVMTAALAVVVSAANTATYGPTITPHETYASYTGGDIPFTVSGFDASERVRVEILGPAPNLQLNVYFGTSPFALASREAAQASMRSPPRLRRHDWARGVAQARSEGGQDRPARMQSCAWRRTATIGVIQMSPRRSPASNGAGRRMRSSAATLGACAHGRACRLMGWAGVLGGGGHWSRGCCRGRTRRLVGVSKAGRAWAGRSSWHRVRGSLARTTTLSGGR
jgi:hypothetical protein